MRSGDRPSQVVLLVVTGDYHNKKMNHNSFVLFGLWGLTFSGGTVLCWWCRLMITSSNISQLFYFLCTDDQWSWRTVLVIRRSKLRQRGFTPGILLWSKILQVSKSKQRAFVIMFFTGRRLRGWASGLPQSSYTQSTRWCLFLRCKVYNVHLGHLAGGRGVCLWEDQEP